jgi:hypothetical protein
MGRPLVPGKGSRRAACRGSEADMAKVIEYYIPSRFKSKVKWIPPELRGKLLLFPADLKKSA